MSEGDAASGQRGLRRSLRHDCRRRLRRGRTFFAGAAGGFCAARAGAIDSGATSVDALSLGRSENCMVCAGAALWVVLGVFGRAVAVSTCWRGLCAATDGLRRHRHVQMDRRVRIGLTRLQQRTRRTAVPEVERRARTGRGRVHRHILRRIGLRAGPLRSRPDLPNVAQAKNLNLTRRSVLCAPRQ